MNYAVIGLGHFGFHLAKGLAEQRNKVVAIDINEERVKEVSTFIDAAYTLDATDKVALKEAGVVEFDVVLVSLGQNIEASILATMALKDLEPKMPSTARSWPRWAPSRSSTPNGRLPSGSSATSR